mmetsp:Transcript_5388/g.10272  ORF Transcript_5388/g.10272 Transcript_5388/m.10272 type:complete len:334 (+) Transcript_5388:115-1116(+)
MSMLCEDPDAELLAHGAIAVLQAQRWESIAPDSLVIYSRLQAACKTLQDYAVDERAEDRIRELKGIEPLTALIASSVAPLSVRGAAAKALQNLACGNSKNQDAVRKANGLVPLVQLAFDAESACDTDAYAASQGALKNLVDRNDENLKDVCQAGGLSILTQVRAYPELPINWDRSVEFTQRLIGTADLLPAQREINREIFAPKPTPGVEIRVISCHDHPCKGAKGLFATKDFHKGTRIIPYVGVVKRRIVGDASNDYLFGVSDTNIDIDAEHAGNESRYVNDHRGVATVKNVQLVEIRSRAGELQVWMEALRTIHSGEEILTHYGSRYSVEEA